MNSQKEEEEKEADNARMRTPTTAREVEIPSGRKRILCF
jgi:hypothetical protein